MPISGEEYKSIGRAAAGAVFIVAVYDSEKEGVIALTVSSFVTLSFDPPLVMFAIQRHSDSYPAVMSCKEFGVSLLCMEQRAHAETYARKGRGKIHASSFERGYLLPVPLIPKALSQTECKVSETVHSGDHAILVGSVEAARTIEGEPLLYFARRFGRFTPLVDEP